MRNNDDDDFRWPSWSDADDVGKFAYVMAGTFVFLVLARIFGW